MFVFRFVLADCDLPDHSTTVSDDNSPVSHGNTVDLICLPGYQSDGNPPVTTSCENGSTSSSTASPSTPTEPTVVPTTAVDTTEVVPSSISTEVSSASTSSSTDSPSTPIEPTEVPTTVVDTTEVVPSSISTEVSSGSTSSSTDSPSTQTEPTEVPTTAVDTTQVVPSSISTEVSSASTSSTTDSPSTQTEPTEVPMTAVDTTEVVPSSISTEVSSASTSSTTDSPSTQTEPTEVPTTAVDTTEVVPSSISTEVSSASTSSTTDSPSTQTEPTEVPTTAVDTTEVVPSSISTEVSSASTSSSTDSPSTPIEPTEVPTTAVDTTSVKTDIKSTVFSTTPITPDGRTFRKTTLHDATTTVITTSKITTPAESTAIATTTDRDYSTCYAPDVESPLTLQPKKALYKDGDVIEYSCEDNKRLVGNPSAVCTDGNFYPSDPLLCLDAACTDKDCESAIGGYCSEEGDCICEPGFTLKNGACVETDSVKVIITLEAKFEEGYEDHSSSEFLELQADICIAFELSFETIGDGDSFVTCFVLSFKPGSVIADVATVITSSSELTADEIAGNMTEQANGNDAGFTLTGMQYNFTVGSSVNASDLNSCDEELHHCDKNYGTCINAGKGSYTCTCAFGSYQDSNIQVEGTACKIDTISTAVIIGASIAGGVALAFIIVLFIWLIAYNKTKNTAVGTKQYQPEVTFSEGIDNRRSMMEQFEDEDDIDQRMQQNAKVISNMTHFNPIPKTNSKYGTPPNVELSSLNTNGYPNQYNGGHSIGV
ncbi:putative endochitinase A [Apostichopus japonicus]|uniref:Putative endochitinase A n=1 Tax=Stichopus japonicus TaxID=307972 RepID=A0A2G8JSD5_STIJA|nr:putative endochitinase A [Apostichopus japonicus]